MEEMKLRIKLTIWNTRQKKYSIGTTRRKKIQNTEDRLRRLWDISKYTKI